LGREKATEGADGKGEIFNFSASLNAGRHIDMSRILKPILK